MPAASSARVTPSETSGTKSAKTGEPNVVRTPAVRLRSLMAVGTPYSGELAPALEGLELTRAGAGQVVGERDERAHRRRRVVVDAMGAFEVVLDELERRHLAPADELALLEGGQVVQLGHASNLGRVPQFAGGCRRRPGARWRGAGPRADWASSKGR